MSSNQSPVTSHQSPTASNQSPTANGQRLAASFWLVLIMISMLVVTGGALAQETVEPAPLADPIAGLETFASRCANCHGEQGLGDGELAANLPNPPTAIGSVDYLRGATPAGLFDIITSGRAQNGMPPFGPESSNPLSEEERWNLVAAIYGLAVTDESITSGETIYQETCVACHTLEEGSEQVNITDPFYLLDTSNQGLFLAMASEDIAEHDFALDDDSLWSVADYLRTFSYVFIDASAPVEAGAIFGAVTNGTTGELFGDGLTVELNAFSPDFGLAFTQTTTVDDTGNYRFDLTDVSPDFIFATIATYEGVQFGTDFGLIEHSTPEVELPLTVYEPTTDPAGITIDQLHIVIEFVDDAIRVSELYQFSQNEARVFVGPTGSVEGGTVTFSLPAGAENTAFDRSFGSLDNLFPAEGVLQTATGWAEIVPLRPGQSTLSLLLRYSLPYDNGLTVAHPVDYDVANVNLVLVEAGVTLTNDGTWVVENANTEEGFSGYGRGSVPAGNPISFTLQGRPSLLTDEAGNAVLARNETTELYIGAGVLLIAIAGVAYWATTWGVNPAGESTTPDRNTLLNQIATLDDTYASGDLNETTYQRQRQTLKNQLLDIWDNTQ